MISEKCFQLFPMHLFEIEIFEMCLKMTNDSRDSLTFSNWSSISSNFISLLFFSNKVTHIKIILIVLPISWSQSGTILIRSPVSMSFQATSDSQNRECSANVPSQCENLTLGTKVSSSFRWRILFYYHIWKYFFDGSKELISKVKNAVINQNGLDNLDESEEFEF